MAATKPQDRRFTEFENDPNFWWLRLTYALKNGQLDEAAEAKRRLRVLGVDVRLRNLGPNGCQSPPENTGSPTIDLPTAARLIPADLQQVQKVCHRLGITGDRITRIELLALSFLFALRKGGTGGQNVEDAAKHLASLSETDLMERLLAGQQLIRVEGSDIDVLLLWQRVVDHVEHEGATQ